VKALAAKSVKHGKSCGLVASKASSAWRDGSKAGSGGGVASAG